MDLGDFQGATLSRCGAAAAADSLKSLRPTPQVQGCQVRQKSAKSAKSASQVSQVRHQALEDLPTLAGGVSDSHPVLKMQCH